MQIAKLSVDDSENSVSSVRKIIVFGNILLALYSDSIRMWDHKTLEFYNCLEFHNDFVPTAVLHPATYLNKIIVGSQTGLLQLWNIRSMNLIYEFPSFGSAISVLIQAPSIDVIAIGLIDGRIIIYDIKLAEEIMQFKQEGRVNAITFRTGALL